MKRSFKYTFLTAFLALAFVFGSMEGMELFWAVKEKEILSDSGRTVVESPVLTWQGQYDNEKAEAVDNTDMERYMLTAEQIEEAIIGWNNRTSETVHSPVEGQISMEEAIQSGENWLESMELKEKGEETDTHFVNAVLEIPKQQESSGQNGLTEQMEPYCSFWTVQFSGEGMNAVLYINAVTGKVWGAEVDLYRNLPYEVSIEKLETFVKLAGLQKNDAGILYDSDGTRAFLEVSESGLCAETEFQHRQKGYFDLTYYGHNYADEDLYYNEYVVITYKLTATEE